MSNHMFEAVHFTDNDGVACIPKIARNDSKNNSFDIDQVDTHRDKACFMKYQISLFEGYF